MSESSNAQRSTGETVEELAARNGITVAALEALLGKPAQRLVRDHIGALLAAMTKRSRETYDCHYDRGTDLPAQVMSHTPGCCSR